MTTLKDLIKDYGKLAFQLGTECENELITMSEANNQLELELESILTHYKKTID